MTRPQSLGRILRSALFGVLAFTSLSVIAGGCLDRPVAPATPTVSARIVTPAKQNKVSKIDLLFMIDNSSSMSDKQTILANVVPALVRRVGQNGCGYEASLEAISRFLIDPDPYETIGITPLPMSPLGAAVLQGTDAVLLKQRSDFLRPDSLVAVMMITDENDCSVQDVGQAFYSIVAKNFLGDGTSSCLTNPNYL